MPDPSPILYLFAGPNGAGKSTFARHYLTQFPRPPRFLNADELARGLSPLDPPSVAIKAGRLLLREIDGCLKKRTSFALESTLSGTTHRRLIEKAKSLGYLIELHYLWIPSPELAIQRIAQRVLKGGHHISENDVRRRYSRSLQNWTDLYAPLVNQWFLWDNSSETTTLSLASESANLNRLKEMIS